MTTQEAPNHVVGLEPGSGEATYEYWFNHLRPNQRRFLLNRMDVDTDAEALRKTGQSRQTLDAWKSSNRVFMTVYDAVTAAKPHELARLQGMKFLEAAENAIGVLTEALTQEPSMDDIKSGIFDARLRQGNLALNVMKELRARMPRQRAGRQKQDPVDAADTQDATNPANIAHLTMGNRSQSEEEDGA